MIGSAIAAGIMSERPSLALELKGTLLGRVEGYRDSSYRDPERTRAEAALEEELSLGATWRFHLHARVRADTARWYERRLRLDLRERRVRAAPLEVREAYLHRRLGAFDLRAGKIVYAWGTADGYNPTDNLNPRDYTDVLRADKLGALSAHVGWQGRALAADLVLLPVYEPSRLPPRDDRYFPELPSSVENPLYPGVGPQALVLDTSFERRRLPAVSWENVQEALRISWKLRGSEVSCTYQRLISDLPAFAASIGLPDWDRGRVDLSVRERFYRQDVYGADFQTGVGDYTLRGEGARVVAREELADDSMIAVAGVDRRFADLVGEQDLTVIVSFLSQRILRPGAARLPAQGLLAVDRPFERGVLGHLIWDLSEAIHLDVSLFTAFSDGSYQDASLSYRVRDPLKIELKLERLSGPEDRYLGANAGNSRLWLELRYAF